MTGKDYIRTIVIPRKFMEYNKAVVFLHIPSTVKYNSGLRTIVTRIAEIYQFCHYELQEGLNHYEDYSLPTLTVERL